MPLKDRVGIGFGLLLAAWVLGNIAYWAMTRF